MSFEFSAAKRPEQMDPNEAVHAEEARWAVDFPTEWAQVQSHLASKVLTTRNTNPEYYVERISTLLNGLKQNPDQQSAEDRIAAALTDLEASAHSAETFKKAA